MSAVGSLGYARLPQISHIRLGLFRCQFMQILDVLFAGPLLQPFPDRGISCQRVRLWIPEFRFVRHRHPCRPRLGERKHIRRNPQKCFPEIFPLRITLVIGQGLQTGQQQSKKFIQIKLAPRRPSMLAGFLLSLTLIGFVGANPGFTPSACSIVVEPTALPPEYLFAFDSHSPDSRFGCLMLLPVRNPIRREMSTSQSSRKAAESFLSDGKKKPASVVFACGRMAYLTGVEPVTF